MLDGVFAGSAYAPTALLAIAVLLVGIRPGIWGFLRFILAVHVAGDVAFGWVWQIMPTYAFMRYIDDADRSYAAIFLAAAVVITDLTYRATRGLLRIVRARFANEPTPGAIGATSEPGFSSVFLIAGLLCKAIFLAGAGVLSGARSLSDLRPADSIGFGAIVMLADFLIPYGVAALRRSGQARWPVLGDVLLLAVISLFSFSKSAFITYVVVYGLGYLLSEGWTRTRREFFNWKSLVIGVLAFVTLGIKSQQRAGLLLDFGASQMSEQAMAGASARFMGGIFRAFTVTLREVRHGWPPLGGDYHAQVAVLVIPHALWPDKPHVASEQLYYLLGVTEEEFGTAFAINSYGCLVFDFGLAGCLIGAAVLGVMLQLGDSAIPSWKELRESSKRGPVWHYLATMWVYLAVDLAEGGIPVAIVSAGALIAVVVILHAFRSAADTVLTAATMTPRIRTT